MSDPTDKPVSGSQVYKRLLSYLKYYKLPFVFSTLGFALFAASGPSLARLMEELVKAFEPDYSGERYLIPLALIGVFALRGVGTFLGEYYMAKVSQGVVHKIRTEMFNRLTVLPVGYLDQHNSGELISRITFNVMQVASAVSDAVKVMIREGFMVIGLIAYMFYQDWKLSLVYVVVGPVIGLIVALVSKRFRRLSHNIQTSMGQLTHVCTEMIKGFRIMRGFGGEDYEKQRFDSASDAFRKQNIKMAKTVAISTPVIQVVVALALGVMMLIALEVSDATSAAAFLAYFTAASLLPKSLRQLTQVNSTIQRGIAAAETIFDQLDETPERDTGQHEVKRVKGDIAFQQVDFRYEADKGNILNGIDLHISPGETVAIVGESGSGKTTLVGLLPRFYNPASGVIAIDQVDISQYTLKSLRQQIAIVNQQVVLLNDTVANNIAYGMEGIDRDSVVRAATLAHALDFIEDLPNGFDELLGEDGSDLSGGQRQRLAIARAILKDAPILILDEATSALDTQSERAIQAAMEEVTKGRTTLIIAHRLSTIENADKIIVMDKGHIVEAGTHMELLQAKGYYAQLHGMQFKGS